MVNISKQIYSRHDHPRHLFFENDEVKHGKEITIVRDEKRYHYSSLQILKISTTLIGIKFLKKV